MSLRFGPDDVHVFHSSGAVDPQVAQVLADETEAFAAKEDRDQGEDDDRHDRVPAEEILDRLLDQAAMPARAALGNLEG